MTQCPQCGLKFSNSPECPNCSHRANPRFEPAGANALVVSYFNTVKTILLTPTRFFQNMPLTGGITEPLTFALITHWIGALFHYFWTLLAGSTLEHVASNFVKFSGTFSGTGEDIDSAARMSHWFAIQQKAAHLFWNWFWGAGSILLDPFKTIIMIFITSMFVYAAARLFVNSSKQSEITYESAIRIVAYGMTPAIIAAFPFLGGFASKIYVMVVTIIGAREAYRTSNSRGGLIVLFPYLLFIGIIAIGLLLAAIVMLKFAVSFF